MVNDSPAQCTESTKESRLSRPTSKGRHTACGAGAAIPLADISAAGRGGDRRPERGGSSDAGRTLVPRERGTAGGRTPAAARQEGGQWYASRIRVVRQRWQPQRGVGGRRGRGAAQAPAPCPPPGGDHARTPDNSRHPAKKAGNKPLVAPTAPPAANGNQGTRDATAMPSATRTRGSTGVVRVSRGTPLSPLPPAGRRPRPDAGQQPPSSEKKRETSPTPRRPPPQRRAVIKAHDMRQRRPPPYEQGEVRGS